MLSLMTRNIIAMAILMEALISPLVTAADFSNSTSVMANFTTPTATITDAPSTITPGPSTTDWWAFSGPMFLGYYKSSFDQILDTSLGSQCYSQVSENFTSWTQAHPTPTGWNMDDGAEVPFPDLSLYPIEKNLPKTCCGTCTVSFVEAQVTYWPPSIDLGGASTLVVDDVTYTSPSIYVGYDLASADDFCGVRTVNDSTIAMTATVSWNPTDLSTLMWKADDGDFTTWFPFELDNYVRRWEDPWCAEDSKWIAFFGGYMATKTFDGVEYNDLVCWPLLAAPSQYDKFHTGLAGCVPDPLGALDPPMAFTAHAPLSATTTAQPLPTWSSHPKPTSRGVVLSPAKTTSSPPRGTQGPQPPQPPQPQHDGGVQGPKAPQNPSDPQLPSNGQDPSNNPKDPNQGTPGRTPPKFPATITVGNSAFPFQIRPSAGATPPALIIGTNTVAAGGPEVTIANVPISLSTDGVLSFNGRTVTIPNSVFSGTDAAGDSGGVEHSSSAESSTGDPTNSNSADGGSSDGSSSGSSSDEYGSSTGDPGAGDQPGDDPSRTDNGNSNPDEQPSIPGTSATAASFRGTTQDQQNSAIFLTQTRMSWISWALAFSLIYFTLT